MKKYIAPSLAVLFPIFCYADTTQVEIITPEILEKNLMVCESQYARTRDLAKYQECSDNILSIYNDLINKKVNTLDKAALDAWSAVTKAERKQLETCVAFAKNTTTNSILVENMYLCQHIALRNLAVNLKKPPFN